MFGSDNDGMLFGYDLTKGYPDLAKDKSEFGNDLIVSVAAQPGYKNSSNIVGGVTVVVWHNLQGGIFAVYEILPAFILCLLSAVVVSLLDKNKDPEMLAEFDAFRKMED